MVGLRGWYLTMASMILTCVISEETLSDYAVHLERDSNMKRKD
jgi:hypothetical protein